MPRDATVHSGIDYPTSVINQNHSSQAWPLVILTQEILQLRIVLPS